MLGGKNMTSAYEYSVSILQSIHFCVQFPELLFDEKIRWRAEHNKRGITDKGEVDNKENYKCERTTVNAREITNASEMTNEEIIWMKHFNRNSS